MQHTKWVKRINYSRKKRKITNTDSNEELGDLFHMDQAESINPGRPLTHIDRNNTKKIHVVTIFVDSFSKKVFISFQRSTRATEAVTSKQEVKVEANISGVRMNSYRADNGIFKAVEFKAGISDKDQTITYCGVGAYHQNSIVEIYIIMLIC